MASLDAGSIKLMDSPLRLQEVTKQIEEFAESRILLQITAFSMKAVVSKLGGGSGDIKAYELQSCRIYQPGV